MFEAPIVKAASWPSNFSDARLSEGTTLHAGLYVALALAVVTWIVLFRTPLGFRIRADWAKPAIYRWTIKIGDRIDAVHIGEADDLSRRIYQYLNPGAAQQANASHRSINLALSTRGIPTCGS